MRGFLTPEEVAEQLKVSRSTVIKWLKRGKLAGQKIGGQWRVDSAGFAAFLRGGTGSPAAGSSDAGGEEKDVRAFTAAQVMQLIGVNRKTLHYWVQEGFIAPSQAGRYGTRKVRLWSFGDLVALRVMQKLRQAGIDLHSGRVVRLLVEHIQGKGDAIDLEAEVLLVTNGREVWELAVADCVAFFAGAGDVFIGVDLGRIVREVQAAVALLDEN